jgi:diguanylate cyclase (GGDEF)-like protein/PAS domain S-box-containing protein
MVKDSNESFFPELSITVSVAVILFMTIARQLLSQVSLRNSREHLAHAQEIAEIGSWEWDVTRDRIERSEEDRRLYGMDETDRAPDTLVRSLEAIHPDDRERVESILRESLREGRSFAYEMRVARRDGDVRTLLVRGEVEIHGGRVTKVHGTRQDITERKRMEVQLQQQADHDPLTGLYNRRRFGEELDKALYHSARYSRPSALLMLDIDHFKLINDTRGHRAGDEALTMLARTILSRLRASDLVGRLGGDEFAIMLHEVGPDEALTIAEDIRVAIAAGQSDPPVRVTGGLLLYDGSNDLIADDALIAADIALYEAKENGKDRVQIYRGSASAAVTWVERIRSALTDGRFALFAQPMVDLHGGEAPYDELLIRMISEAGELISPGEFLPVAERFGLINEIDRWVTREGLHIAQLGNRVSINLSAHSIGDPRILDALREAVIAGLAPKHVIFEITESAAMRNMDEARTFAQALIELGCELALDDFGTGFGSFIYLKHLPAQYLKIDMEFVREMVFNDTDRQVVDSITKVAHSLGKQTIAEGVEDEATLDALREYGVDRAQGFFVGRPVRISPLMPFEQAVRRPLAKMEE